jgi:pimeloyl-ACP methyl ester carboxylesterase
MTTTPGTETAAPAAATKDVWIEGPAGRLHLAEIPGPADREPVLFVHCFAGDVSFWSDQLAHLARGGRRALALELRGHGASAPPAGDDYSIAGMARDLEAAADRLGLGRFVLVAHSLGAAVAGHYAGAHPERVSALVLVDPAGDNPRLPREFIDPYRQALATDGYREAVEHYLKTQLTAARPGVAERLLGNVRRAPRALVVNATVAILDYSVLPDLATYRAAGGRAMTVTADKNQGPLTLHALMPDLPRRHVAGTSHFLALDDPAAFNQVLDQALAGTVWPAHRS